jgi:hypothetical protein
MIKNKREKADKLNLVSIISFASIFFVNLRNEEVCNLWHSYFSTGMACTVISTN